MRVVSLMPSATDIVHLLGAGSLLVGRSHDAVRPAVIHEIPVVTKKRTAASDHASPDTRVVRTSGSLGRPEYTLDTSRLIELGPDLIITGTQGSVSDIELQIALDAVLKRTGQLPRVLRLDPASIEDIVDDVLRVAEAINEPKAGTRAAMTLRSELLEAQEWVTPFAGHGKLVVFLEETDPLVVAGHWIVQIIERAGGIHPCNPGVSKPNAGAAAGPQQAQRIAGPSIPRTPDALTRSLPEVVIVSPRGADLDQAECQTRRLLAQDWFKTSPAARSGQIFAVDSRHSFHSPGPGIVPAFRWMVGLLQQRSSWLDEVPWMRVHST